MLLDINYLQSAFRGLGRRPDDDRWQNMGVSLFAIFVVKRPSQQLWPCRHVVSIFGCKFFSLFYNHELANNVIIMLSLHTMNTMVFSSPSYCYFAS